MILNKTLPLLLVPILLAYATPGGASSEPHHAEIIAAHAGAQGCPYLRQMQLSQDRVQDTTPGCGRAPASCPAESKYRSYDGSCNNLKNPSWGVTEVGYSRLLPAHYADGISSPPVAKSGKPLPGARAVSAAVYPDVNVENPNYTLIAMQYGQFLAHDMSFIKVHVQPNNCCPSQGPVPEHCFPIPVPADDPAYSKFNITCMRFVRTMTDRDLQCVGGNQSAEQVARVNNYIDMSHIYGNSAQEIQLLRTFKGGKLITEHRHSQDWLPRNKNLTGNCTLPDPKEPCYFGGDQRINQNPQLAVLQIIFLREHNRLANALAKLNPRWDDETIFQEARKINIGQHQLISYYEMLPKLIGLENALKNKIIFKTDTWVDDYDPTVNPAILNEHATAAFRFFHTLIAGQLDLVDEKRKSTGNIKLSDWVDRPGILEQNNSSFDALARGMTTQSEQAADVYHTTQITQNWQRLPGQPLGRDLKAICIQRNRDHGLAPYNDYRPLVGLPRAKTFQDFSDVISKENIDKLAALYEHPDDVDLTVGGSLEGIVPGTLSGPTFLYILTEQFRKSRKSDRMWFENSGDVGFTQPQLAEIRKASIARILCDNGLNIKSMQAKAFEKISPTNPLVSCESLPSVNLTLWKAA